MLLSGACKARAVEGPATGVILSGGAKRRSRRTPSRVILSGAPAKHAQSKDDMNIKMRVLRLRTFGAPLRMTREAVLRLRTFGRSAQDDTGVLRLRTFGAPLRMTAQDMGLGMDQSMATPYFQALLTMSMRASAVSYAGPHSGHRHGSGVSRIRRRQYLCHRPHADAGHRRSAAADRIDQGSARARGRSVGRRPHVFPDQRLDQRQSVHDDDGRESGRRDCRAAQLAQVDARRSGHERRAPDLHAARGGRSAAHGSLRHARDRRADARRASRLDRPCTSFRRRTTASPPISRRSSGSFTMPASCCWSTRRGGRTSIFIRRCRCRRRPRVPICASTPRTKCCRRFRSARCFIKWAAAFASTGSRRCSRCFFRRRRTCRWSPRSTWRASKWRRRAPNCSRARSSWREETRRRINRIDGLYCFGEDTAGAQGRLRPRPHQDCGDRQRTWDTPDTRPRRSCAAATTFKSNSPIFSTSSRSLRSGRRPKPPIVLPPRSRKWRATIARSTCTRRPAFSNAGFTSAAIGCRRFRRCACCRATHFWPTPSS